MPPAEGSLRPKNNRARLLALLMAIAQWADSAKLRRLFPQIARSRLHGAKKWLFRQPVRFAFNRDPSDAVRLVVAGEPFADWVPALTAPETWRAVPTIAEVVLKLDDSPLALDSLPPPTPGLRTIVLPLRENAIAVCPRGLGLYPSAEAVAILRDKRRFADYVTKNGLARLCPANYMRPEDIALPCIVKPAYEHERAVVVRTREALETLLEGGALPRRFAFQEFIPGATEYTIHCIMRHGRPVWSRSFVFEKDGDARVGVEFKSMAPFDPPPAVLDAVERLLRPLDYSGPCNIDYTLRPAGPNAVEIAVFEINPRFGGTMFLPQTRRQLTEALTCLVAEARTGVAW
jgi:hypothetical protein